LIQGGTNHFANNYSPLRENRETFFANTGSSAGGSDGSRKPPPNEDGTKTPENLNQPASAGPSQPGHIGKLSQQTHAELSAEAPEALSKAPEAVAQSPALVTTLFAGNFMNDEQRRRFESIAQRWLGDAYKGSKHLTEQMIAYLNEHPDAANDTEFCNAIATVLSDPQNVWQLARDGEERSAQYDRYRTMLQQKFGDGFGALSITSLDLERIAQFEKELPEGMSFTGWLLEKPNDKMRMDDACSSIRGIADRGIDRTFQFPDLPKERSEKLDEATVALRALWARWRSELEKKARDPVTGEWTTSAMEKRIYEGYNREEGIRRMQDNDMWGDRGGGSEIPLDPQNAARLKERTDALRYHLDIIIARRAKNIEKQILKRLENAGIPQDILQNPDAHSEEIARRFGTTAHALIHEISDLLSAPTSAQRKLTGEDEAENLVKFGDEQYLSKANVTLGQLSDLEKLLTDDDERLKELPDLQKQNIISKEDHDRCIDEQGRLTDEGWLLVQMAKERLDHRDAVETISELARRYDAKKDRKLIADLIPAERLQDFLETGRHFRDGKQTPADYDLLYNEFLDVAPRTSKMLYLAQFPTALARYKEIGERAEERIASGITAESVRADFEKVRDALLPGGALCEELQHPVCTAMGVQAGLNAILKNTEELVKAGEKTDNPEKALAKATGLITMLQICHEELSSLPDRTEFIKTADAFVARAGGNERARTKKGRYSTVNGHIYINEEVIGDDAEKRERALEHERGHAIVDILTRRSGVFVGRLINMHRTLKDTPFGGEGQTFDDLLKGQAQLWRVDIHDDPQRVHDHLMDELLVRYADYKAKRYKPLEQEKTLFTMLEEKDVAFDEPTAPRSAQELANSQRWAPDDDDEEGVVPAMPTMPSDGTVEPEIIDTNQLLRDIRVAMHELGQFFEAYPEARSVTVPRNAAINARRNGDTVTAEEDLADMQIYQQEHIEDVLRRGEKETAERNLRVLKERADNWRKFIKKMDNESMRSVYQAGMRRRDLGEILKQDFTFVNIMDIYGVAKSIKEDILRMWKRRGEASQAKLGGLVTGWIPSWVPYVGRLKHEFNRRNQTSELEEVRQYRDAFKNIDSYALQERLADPSVKSTDEVKALFEELTERGRMDWNNEGMWRKLCKLSRYQMPFGPCRNNDVLRDKWLLKMITDIWSDKDNYYNWRRANDSGVESGKKKFTATGDQLSNLDGGLSGELGRQLKMYVEGKDSGNIPDQVNPHLYEELIHYAIRNGKMSMEAKFFYLIQGVRHGLLSIDRLRVLAGEGGEVMSIFPFIDYFYQKNNDMAFMKQLGQRLEEGGGDERYKPGIRTTMFVRLEIAREQAVKERLRKGQSKSGEKIDHDDIPYFLPELDYTGISDWYTAAGGRRQKLSFEAVKNSYVGFSMKFKALAAFAQIDNGAKFSDADVENLVDTIGSCILSDNILTRNGFDGDYRPTLSESEIRNTKPVMGDAKLFAYRTNLNSFTGQVAHLLDTDAWGKINKAINVTKDELKVNAENFTAGDDFLKNTGQPDLAKNIHMAVPAFLAKLKETVRKNPKILLNLLRTAADSFVGDAVVGADVTMDQMIHAYSQTSELLAAQPAQAN